MLLIERYVAAEVGRPLLATVGVLTFIFASYAAERYLAEAAEGTLALGVVADIVLYKVLIALELIVPLGLYLSVAVSLGRLYHDGEMTALAAAGVSPRRVYGAVALLAAPLVVGVALLSLQGRPWAYHNAYQLEQRSRTELDVHHLQANRFNINRENGRMILARRIDAQGVLHDLLIYDPGDTRSHLFRAARGRVTDPTPRTPALELQQGNAYQLEHRDSRDQQVTFQTFVLRPEPVDEVEEYRRKAAPGRRLAASTDRQDRAELQWRRTRGISVLLLALLAIPLSHTAPRRGRFARLLPVVAVYALVYYAGYVLKSLVAGGVLPVAPGLWLLPLAMAAVLLGLLVRQWLRTRDGSR